MIDTAEELDLAIRAIAGEIAGAIEALSGAPKGSGRKRSAVRSGRPR